RRRRLGDPRPRDPRCARPPHGRRPARLHDLRLPRQEDRVRQARGGRPHAVHRRERDTGVPTDRLRASRPHPRPRRRGDPGAEREVGAQIEKFLALVKRAPTHLDTHHHVGLYAPVSGVVLAAAKRLGVPVRSQNVAARARARAAGLRTPDHFFGESGPGAYWTLATTLARLRDLPPGVSEFMAHPGVFDDALAQSRYARQRETELVGVGTAAARSAAMALGITLCDFGRL